MIPPEEFKWDVIVIIIVSGIAGWGMIEVLLWAFSHINISIG